VATEDCRNTPITPLCTCATRAAISLLLFFLFFCWNRIPRAQITELLGLPHCKAASGDQALPLSSSMQRSGVETIRALQQAGSICYKNKRRKHSNDIDVFFFCCNPEKFTIRLRESCRHLAGGRNAGPFAFACASCS
jgi:hypothetical protein